MIEINNLKYSYDKSFFRKKLSNYNIEIENLSIKKGSKITICGLNGSGKSTFIKLLSGVLSANEGKINVMGFNPIKDRKEYVKNISVIWGQRSGLWQDLTPLENFEVFSKLYRVNKLEAKKIIDKSIAELNCESFVNRQVRKLSLGQRIKIEIIASLIHSPKILFYDEAFLGLDFKSKAKIIEYLNRYIEENDVTLFLISHDIEDLVQMCDEMLFLEKGRIILRDKIKNIISKELERINIKINFYGMFKFDNIKKYIGNEIFITKQAENFIELSVITTFSRSNLIRLLANDNNLLNIEFSQNSLENVLLQIVK